MGQRERMILVNKSCKNRKVKGIFHTGKSIVSLKNCSLKGHLLKTVKRQYTRTTAHTAHIHTLTKRYPFKDRDQP
jgi:hypothetical protein